MKDWIVNLLALQETDMRIRGIKERLKMLPKERVRLDEESKNEKTQLEESKTGSLKTELEIKQVESSIAEINEEINRLQSQSIMIKKNDEYKALLHEIDTCKEKISQLETTEINLLDDLEAKHEEFRENQKHFSER